ncbi:MAG: hypothetical protein LBE08_06640, partial [Bifidobacteriaceae bacterium]|nr:hypothetical protein [Bifidobacteriaceae bacterium]
MQRGQAGVQRGRARAALACQARQVGVGDLPVRYHACQVDLADCVKAHHNASSPDASKLVSSAQPVAPGGPHQGASQCVVPRRVQAGLLGAA